MNTKKDAYYFPHFSNARGDRKLRRVIKELGMEGYGIYFCILEVLREQTNFRYPVCDIDLLSDEFLTSEQKVRTIVSNYNLFEIDNENYFYSPKLIEFLQPYLLKSERARNAAKLRWNKHNAKAMQMHSKSNANELLEQCDSYASKVKESKVNKDKNKPVFVYNKFYDEQLKLSGNDKYYEAFIDYLFKNNSNNRPLSKVLSMSDQITFERFKYYTDNYSNDAIKSTIEAIENYTKKTYKSFNLTLNKWIQKD